MKEKSAGWVDEFDSFNSRWRTAEWSFDLNLTQFHPANVKVSDGTLRLVQEIAPEGFVRPYRGGEVYTPEEFQYGRFRTTMKPSAPSGIVASFFLTHIEFDSSGKPTEWREIDIEFPGRTDTISFALHWIPEGGKDRKSVSHQVKPGFDMGDGFHEFEIEWRRKFVRFFVDGREIHRFDDPEIMRELAGPMSIHMNHWVADIPGWVGPFDPSVLPCETQYDSISFDP